MRLDLLKFLVTEFVKALAEVLQYLNILFFGQQAKKQAMDPLLYKQGIL